MKRRRILFHSLRIWNLLINISAILAVISISQIKNIIDIALILVATSAVTIFVFSFNNIFDTKFDMMRSDGKMNMIALGYVTKNQAIIISVLFAILGISASIPLGFNRIIIAILSVIIGIIYSMPPMRLKDRIGFDILTHIVLGGFLPVFYVTMNITEKLFPILIFFSLVGLVGQLWNQISDYDIDKKSFVKYLGLKKSRFFHTIICLFGAIYFSWTFFNTMNYYFIPIILMFFSSIFLFKTGNYRVFKIPWILYSLSIIFMILGI